MEMQKAVLDQNVIPPMTHPYVAHWTQPDPKNLVLDNDYAMMSKKDFDRLPDYTRSEPTGKYNGKMWKELFQVSGILMTAMYLRSCVRQIKDMVTISL